MCERLTALNGNYIISVVANIRKTSKRRAPLIFDISMAVYIYIYIHAYRGTRQVSQ